MQTVVENWKAIPGWEGLYQASDQGRIRSLPIAGKYQHRRGRVLKPAICHKGYQHLRLSGLDGSYKAFKVHTAVAAAFLGPRPDGMQVNHINGIKTDNRACNLEYVTCRENIRHGWEHGLYSAAHSRGSNNIHSRLTQEDVMAIRAIYPAKSLKELGVMFGVTTQAVWAIVHRKTWQHVS